LLLHGITNAVTSDKLMSICFHEFKLLQVNLEFGHELLITIIPNTTDGWEMVQK